MRYDKMVSFVLEKGEFNSETGNTDTVISKQTGLMANVSDMSTDKQKLYYGKLKNEAYTIIIQGRVPHAFDYIIMRGKKYTVDRSRELPLTTTIFMSGGG